MAGQDKQHCQPIAKRPTLGGILMRTFNYIMIIFIGLVSCNQKQETKATIIKHDPVSQWLLANEDSLAIEFRNMVFTTALCKKCDTTWGEKAYQQYDSITYMGKFSLLVNKYCDSTEVTYFYNKGTNPKLNILLTSLYNKERAAEFDSILNSIESRKYFQVDKYLQPDTSVGSTGFRDWQLLIKDMRVKTVNSNSVVNLTIYLCKKWIIYQYTKDYLDDLKKELFGELLLSNKIGKIDFEFADTINNNLPTIYKTLISLK